MKKKTLPIILFLISTIAYSQKTKVENNEIEILYHWTKEIVKNSIWTSVKLNSDLNSLKNIYVKLKMTSIDKSEKEFQINKFILIDDKNKLKIRPNNISYQVVAQVYSFQKLSIDKDIINVEKYRLQYDETVTDYFKEYSFPGYETLEIPTNFGSKENPELHITYFKPLSFKQKKISLFYAVPSNINNATLYYGEKKIADLEF